MHAVIEQTAGTLLPGITDVGKSRRVYGKDVMLNGRRHDRSGSCSAWWKSFDIIKERVDWFRARSELPSIG